MVCICMGTDSTLILELFGAFLPIMILLFLIMFFYQILLRFGVIQPFGRIDNFFRFIFTIGELGNKKPMGLQPTELKFYYSEDKCFCGVKICKINCVQEFIEFNNGL